MVRLRRPQRDLALVTCRGKHGGRPCPLQRVDPSRVGRPCFWCGLPTERVWQAVRSADGSLQVVIMETDDD